MKLKFVVLGEPQGKGRPRFSKVGPHVKTRTPDETILYENLIRSEYQRQCGSARFPDETQLDVRILAFYPVPSSVSKKKRRMMLDHQIRPGKKPDWDNIGKVVTDSLNQIAYRDDAQVVDAQVLFGAASAGGHHPGGFDYVKGDKPCVRRMICRCR